MSTWHVSPLRSWVSKGMELTLPGNAEGWRRRAKRPVTPGRALKSTTKTTTRARDPRDLMLHSGEAGPHDSACSAGRSDRILAVSEQRPNHIPSPWVRHSTPKSPPPVSHRTPMYVARTSVVSALVPFLPSAHWLDRRYKRHGMRSFD